MSLLIGRFANTAGAFFMYGPWENLNGILIRGGTIVS